MSLIEHGELVQRAIAYILEQQTKHPKKTLSFFLDEAGMRFNLTPLDSQQVRRLLEKTPENRTTLDSSVHPSTGSLHDFPSSPTNLS